MFHKLPAVYIVDLNYSRDYKSYALNELMKNGDYSKIVTIASDNLDRRYPYNEDARDLIYASKSGVILLANVLRLSDNRAELLLEILTKDPNMNLPERIGLSLEHDSEYHVDSGLITMVANFNY